MSKWRQIKSVAIEGEALPSPDQIANSLFQVQCYYQPCNWSGAGQLFWWYHPYRSKRRPSVFYRDWKQADKIEFEKKNEKKKSEMEHRGIRATKTCSQGFWISLLVFLCMITTTQVEGSIHEYRNEAFTPKTNAFFFHGGSEGLYASKAPPDSSATTQSGKSFIR